MSLRNGDEVVLGERARFRFEQASARRGELPGWALLTRVESAGNSQVCVVLLTEATIGAASHAAVRLDPRLAGDESLRVRAVDSGLAIAKAGAPASEPLRDGQILRLGQLAILVKTDEHE